MAYDNRREVTAHDLTTRGIHLHHEGDLEGAKIHYLAALGLDPNEPSCLINLGQIASNSHKLEAAEAFARRAIQVSGGDHQQYSNLGNVLTRRGKFLDANEALESALNLSPESCEIWHNAGILRMFERKYEEAITCFEKVISLGGGTVGTNNDLAHAHLALGNLETGLELYEARWVQLQHLTPWDYHIPEWQGENLWGKKILVHAEQGHGDTIMTARFIAVLEESGANIVVAVPSDMAPLIKHMGYNVVTIEAIPSVDMTQFDYHTPMMSMMRWLKVRKETISSKPYIQMEPVAADLDCRYRVGICWASGRRNNDHDFRGRYSDLQDWIQLVGSGTAKLVSLQKGSDADDVQKIFAEGIIDDTSIAACHNWLDTARLIATLDAVVSVDTAIVHLAGAMGKPVLMLAQHTNCWRWWNIDKGTGWPWYQNVTILRQENFGVWDLELATGMLWNGILS